jgi:hypothetical protein
MTTPAAPDDGKFVTSDAVLARSDGDIPADRVTWIKWRILDVENELLGLVPSLQTLDPDTGDPIRVGRVQSLIIDKVLDLYENPRNKTVVTQSMEGLTETHQYGGRYSSGVRTTGISFSEDELDRVRPPKVRRPKLGTLGASPWGV